MKLTVAAYSEDKSAGSDVAYDWFVLLAKRVIPGAETHHLIHARPRGNPEAAMLANAWKERPSSRDRALIKDLVNDIAGRLTAGHIVVIHVDQDGSDENVSKLERLVLNRVRELLEQQRKDLSVMEHRLVLAPNRAIEAWCYLNLLKLQQLVAGSTARATRVFDKLVAHLEASPEHHLDKCTELKGIVQGPPVDNRELVTKGSGYPIEEAVGRSPSLQDTLESFEKNHALVDYVRRHVVAPD